jgi:hypothetical protein
LIGSGKIKASGLTALLFVVLVVAAITVAYADSAGGTGLASAGNVSKGNVSINDSSLAGNVSKGNVSINDRSLAGSVTAGNNSRAGSGPATVSPGPVSGGFDFDRWGWGGLGPDGIVGAGSCGYNRHGHGNVWNYWRPAPF